MGTSLDNEALTRLLIGAITTQGYILKTLSNRLKNGLTQNLMADIRLELMDLGDTANPILGLFIWRRG